MLLPLDPASTMDLKLLNSEREACASLPVLSRASFRIIFTWVGIWRSFRGVAGIKCISGHCRMGSGGVVCWCSCGGNGD